MQTRDLIETLASDARPARGPSMLQALIGCAALSLVYCVVAILAVRGARPDFMGHMTWVAVKAGLSLVFALCAFVVALRLARPGQGVGVWGGVGLAALGAACATAVTAAMMTAPEERMAAVTGGAFPHSVLVIPVMAIPAGAILFLWFRAQAPTRLRLAGAAAGALAGGLSAMAYALACPVDSVAFIATWYTLAIAICAGAGALVGWRALRW